MNKYLKKLPYQFLVGILLSSIVLTCLTSRVDASYNANNLVSDPVFTAYTSMSQSDIQNFLATKNSGLTNYKDTEDCGDPGGAHYALYAAHYSCGQYVLASQIIFDAAQVYQVSPRVILATLQKEQSLVTTPNPTSSQLNCAMGYNSCGGYVGFFTQIDNGTWDLERLYQRANGNNTYWNTNAYPCASASSLYSTGLYPGSTVTFYDPGGTPETILLATASTAALYCYTPYVGPYNVTGYSGSYNFVYYFELWWGSSTDACIVAPVPAITPIPHTPTNGDYNGDGKTDIGIYRPSDGCWHIRGVQDFGYGGQPGDIPVPGDYNGDGVTDAAIYRPSEGGWHIRGVGDYAYGESTDIPVPGDYNASGKTEIAVYRPSDGTWHIRGVGDFQYGEPGDIPVPGNYDPAHPNVTEAAVFRPSDGTWHIRGVGDYSYGQFGDIPVPGDYSGSGVMSIAVYRPSQGGWHIRGVGDYAYGASTDIPVPGDYNGDGITDIAVYRPVDGSWHIRGVGDYAYGASTDIPVSQTLNAMLLKQYGLIAGY